jgi:2-polyprenyl-6-methoxyphenol hydroxylase-like FAD-dependent oxidoreductase
MTTTMNRVTQEVPVRCRVEILVAGGGPAGMAAAMAVEERTHVRGISVSVLQRALLDIGAFLPNAGRL